MTGSRESSPLSLRSQSPTTPSFIAGKRPLDTSKEAKALDAPIEAKDNSEGPGPNINSSNTDAATNMDPKDLQAGPEAPENPPQNETAKESLSKKRKADQQASKATKPAKPTKRKQDVAAKDESTASKRAKMSPANVDEVEPRRSGRARKPASKAATPVDLTKSPEVEKAGKAGKAEKPKATKNKFDSILTSTNSLFAMNDYGDTKVPLVQLLAQSAAWNALERSQKLKLLSMLPGDAKVTEWPEDMEPPNYLQPELESVGAFREACADFQKNLHRGHYTAAFLRKASDAMKTRVSGTIDDWKENEMEHFWGQKGIP